MQYQTSVPGRKGWLVFLLAVLAVGILLTTALLGQRLRAAALDDSGIILLVTPEKTKVTEETKPSPQTEQAETVPSADLRQVSRPGFSAEDEKQVWETNTRVEIFKIAYDEMGEVTVLSPGGDRLFAPGTANSYPFRFKNNGNVPVDYTMTVKAYITPEETSLPIQAKMNRFDGSWLVGSQESWEPVLTLNGVTDSGTLGVNRYANYTLDWQWPFETADETGDIRAGDAYDTLLGNLAAGEDITLTVEIQVAATADTGGQIPATGDESLIGLFVLLMLISGTAFVLLILDRRKRKSHGG